MERGLDTTVRRLRRQVFTEVAKVAFDSENVQSDIEAIAYKLFPSDEPKYRENIWRERAVASERVRLAMGLSLRPEDHPVHVTAGLAASNIADKYYEPPLMQVIPSACDACAVKKYTISDACRGCTAHPCMEVCPKGAIYSEGGKSHIDQEKCVKCGRCKSVCPYDAVSFQTRPCADACGVGAITSDELGRAKIDPEKCVSCGMCMVNCPFGAIADKSQIFQLIQALKRGDRIACIIAPSFVGQFGPNVGPRNMKAALLSLGFFDVFEVALGADMGAVTEAHQYVKEVVEGDLPFLLTSCCPAWAMLARIYFPDTVDSISNSLTPMVATARTVKQKHPDCRVVFIGPCAAKKLEASRRHVRSDVDFVITYEELAAIFEARGIDPNELDAAHTLHDATGAGRGYGVAGGVAGAIEKCINEYYPGTEIKIEHAEGLADCKKILQAAKNGKMNGYLIEGMGCPGGCIAGAGTVIPINKAANEVKRSVSTSSRQIPPKELREIELE